MKALTSNEQSILEALADGTFYSVTELYSPRPVARRPFGARRPRDCRPARPQGPARKVAAPQPGLLANHRSGYCRSRRRISGIAVARGYTITLLPMRDVDQAVLAALESLWAKTQAETRASPTSCSAWPPAGRQPATASGGTCGQSSSLT